MISDKDFDGGDFDRIFHPGVVTTAINNDGGYGLFEASIECDDKAPKLQVYTT